MTANSVRRMIVAFAMLATSAVAVETNAFCCGGGATTAYYPGSYNAYYGGSYSAYYPGTYQAYSGWYPGYYLNRISARLWGSPSTYVAAYPSTYAASYAPTYTAAYQPAYSGYATSYAAPSGCSSCSTHTAAYSPCSTCAPAQQVTLRPVCTTACSSPCGTANCSSCSGCSTCGTGAVSQTSYQQSAPQSNGCSTCGMGAPIQRQTQGTEPSREQRTFDQPQSNGAPNIAPDANVPLQREEQKPPTNGESEIQPAPGDDNIENDPYDTSNEDGSTYFQAPKLFDPNDRTAQRGIAPVTKAVYQKPVSYRSVSSRPITAKQAQQDALGWTSASN